MAFPRDPRDTVVEMFIDGGWVDATATEDVYGREPLTLSSGRQDESQGFSPATCGFTLNNRTGKYNPRNPLGAYYGKIGRNTPVRVKVRTVSDRFTRTVVNGWGTATTGQAYTVAGVGGTVQASDFQVAGGFATHSVPAVNSWRASYFPPTVLKHRNVDAAVTVSLPFTNVTGASVEVANFMFHVSGTPTYYLIRVLITTAEAVQIVAFSPSGAQVGALTTVPGLTHSSSQALRVRAQCDGLYFRAKVWAASGSEPLDWPFITGHGGFVAGGVGLRSGVALGNTNTLPIVFTYSDFQVSVPRFAGEVGTWNQRWNDGTADAVTVVEAGGILRRLGQGNAVFDSAPRREASRQTYEAYWPLEESALAKAGRPLVGPSEMQLVGGSDPSRQWGQGQLGVWLPNGVARQEIGELSANAIPQVGFVGSWSVSWIMAGGRAHNDIVFACQAASLAVAPKVFTVDFSATENAVQVTAWNGGTFSTTSPTLFSGGVHHVAFNADEGSGLVKWHLEVDGVPLLFDSTGQAGSLQPLESVRFRNLVDNGSDPLSIEHVAVSTGTVSSLVIDAAFGFAGETAGTRILRLCYEEGIPFTYIGTNLYPGGPIVSVTMGPQYQDSLLAAITECAVADMGELYEPRGATGLEFRTGRSLYSQTVSLALDFAADHLAPPLEPADDDQQTRNKIRATRRNGGEAEVSLTVGPLSTAEPSAGGIGTYETSLTVNVHSDDQLPDVAGWLLHLGTFDGARYPQVRVSLGRPAIANDPSIANAAMDVNLGDRIVIRNASVIGVYDDINLIVRGISESIDAFEHLITFNCTPEDPYHVRTWDNASFRWDSSDSRLTGGTLSAGGLSFQVAFDSVRWTTDGARFPMNIKIGGEVITLSGISGTTSPQTFTASARAVNGVSKSHAVNEKVSLADPAYWGH